MGGCDQIAKADGRILHAPMVQVFLMRFVIVVPLAHSFIGCRKKLLRLACLDVIVDEGDVEATSVAMRFHLAGFPSLGFNLFRGSDCSLRIIKGKAEVAGTGVLEAHNDVAVGDHLAW